MYGPVNACTVGFVSYVEGVCASYFFAYSSGTGAVRGIESAFVIVGPNGVFSLKTSVVLFGVSMPEIVTCGFGDDGAPTSWPKYAAAYPLGTAGVNPRSIAYL